VKESREDLRKDPDVSRMAEVVNAQSGWRFDLVVLNKDRESDVVAREAEEPSVEALAQALDRAEQAARAGQTTAALVLAWASLEAAMRRAARTVS
jgi:hypothetical protein